VGYQFGKSDRVPGRNRAIRLESLATGWLTVALASECKGTVEGQLSLDRLTDISRSLPISKTIFSIA
jgi:hypothetical protein